MVYIPRLNFKSGISPSLVALFPTDNKFSGTQKLLLTRTRIFGNKISGNLRSGMKIWKQTAPARFEYLAKQKIQMHDLYKTIPDLHQVKDQNWDNIYARKIYRQQVRVQKQAKKAAKQTKKKK